MNASKDYYDILGVDEDASDRDLKRAHRRLVKEHHPDRGGDEERFVEVQEAYEVLSDEALRGRYDQARDRRFGGFSPDLSGYDFSQGATQASRGFSEKARREFEEFFNGVRGDWNSSTWATGGWDIDGEPSDYEAHAVVDFETACLGGKTHVTGPNGHQYAVSVPLNTKSGDRLRIRRSGGRDMIVEFMVREREGWRRDGLNLYRDVEVSPWIAMLGGSVEIEDLSGNRLKMNLSERTPPGERFRFRGMGIADPDQPAPGNMYCDVRYKLNGDLTDRQLELLRELQDIEEDKE
jgi:DnaJ-class molecular chaperone